ncbi:MAG TPA: serine/threonine-protein kinase [Actinospica sp.]|nr:serine/threonine-protein kinase [Actinospica sp.]
MNASGEPSDIPMDRAIAEPLGPDDPREIGQFTIIGVLGTGGMGEVYLGTTDDQYVAVKRVRPRLVSSERFKREVGILFRVPVGVAPSVLATDGTVSRPWFAAEYVPGLTVDEAVRLGGPLPAESLWLLLAETAAQLRKVHEIGIVHRDLKPANVMLVRDGVKLIDFGIARAADQQRLTRSGGSYGTRGFTAPEQEAGDENVAAPADVYALGALLVYAASGRTPGVVPDIEAMRAVDADLADIIESCFAELPSARPTAAALEELARMRVTAGESAWPEPVEDRIAARRAFAATPVGKLETLPPPDEEQPQAPTHEMAGVATGRPRPRRAKRLVVVPIAAVLAAGGAIAYVLVPSTSSAHSGAQLSTSSSDVLTASTKSVGASSTPQPSRSASASIPVSATATTLGGGAASQTTTAAQGGGQSTTTPATAPTTTAVTTHAATVVAASSISGISGNDDPEHVNGSEGDVSYVANDAECSAWLDSNGTGNLAGVLNTSGLQACGAELYRSDGIHYRFAQSSGAAKTNFISGQGYTMYICVWNENSPSTVGCGNKFTMSGTTPVEQ